MRNVRGNSWCQQATLPKKICIVRCFMPIIFFLRPNEMWTIKLSPILGGHFCIIKKFERQTGVRSQMMSLETGIFEAWAH